MLEAGEPPHASTPLFDVATGPLMESVVIPAAAPFGQVLHAVARAQPTHLVGYASVIGRLARAASAGDLDHVAVLLAERLGVRAHTNRPNLELACDRGPARRPITVA